MSQYISRTKALNHEFSSLQSNAITHMKRFVTLDLLGKPLKHLLQFVAARNNVLSTIFLNICDRNPVPLHDEYAYFLRHSRQIRDISQELL